MRTFLPREKKHVDLNPNFLRQAQPTKHENYLLLLILLFLLLELKE